MRLWTSPSGRRRSCGSRWSTNSPTAGATSSCSLSITSLPRPARTFARAQGRLPARRRKYAAAALCRRTAGARGNSVRHTFRANTPEGHLLANEVLSSAEIDLALARCIEGAVGSRVVNPGTNRKAIRQLDPPTYGSNFVSLFRHAALYADRILRSAVSRSSWLQPASYLDRICGSGLFGKAAARSWTSTGRTERALCSIRRNSPPTPTYH